MTQVSSVTTGLKAYMRDVGKYPVLKWPDVQELFAKMKDPMTSPRERDAIKTKLVNANLRFVISIAKKYAQNGVPLLDLIQEGNIGLMTGIDRFEPERGFRLTTYVAFWIRQAITKHLTDRARTVRLPSHIVAILPDVKKAATELQDAGLPIDMDSIAAKLNVTPETVRATIGAMGGTKSMTHPGDPASNHDEGDLERHVSSVGPEEYVDTLKLRDTIRGAFSKLTQREEQVLRLRFGCAEALDNPKYMLSQEALDKLKARAAKRDGNE